MLRISKYDFRAGVMLIIPALFFVACSNDKVQVKEVTKMYDGPLLVQEEVHFTFTDSALKRIEMFSPLVEDFSHLQEDPYLEFPKGIKVVFYKTNGEIETVLESNYAKRLIEQNLWEARGNVRVSNSKKEKLNTEVLFWSEKNERIYSDDEVKITTPDNIIKGDGFEADQYMTDYTIFNVTGTILLNEDENSDEE